MENSRNDAVPYIVHEGEMARMERVNGRLWVIVILLIIALLATNGAWIWWANQWETFEETTVTQDVNSDNGGNANLNGDVNIYGSGSTDSNGN